MEKNFDSSPARLMAGELAAENAPRPLSVFDMFRIGIGPSSSHTVGPLRAGYDFSKLIKEKNIPISKIEIDLFGSLAATGRGHSTDRAVLLGLNGNKADSVDTQTVKEILNKVAQEKSLKLLDGQKVPFNITEHMHFRPLTILPYHVNALTITAYPARETKQNREKISRTYYSTGGGFVMAQVGGTNADPELLPLDTAKTQKIYNKKAPYPFASGKELLQICQENQISVAEVVWQNEISSRTPLEVKKYISTIYQTMCECIENGCNTHGIMPGGLEVPRRAATLAKKIMENEQNNSALTDPLHAMEWVNLYALAVNEENAAGHRVVTAPTNGAAGIVPAVIAYMTKFCSEAQEPNKDKAVRDFILAATAIGTLIKTNASIAGAEVGCQGEVGSASAMAAAGLAQALGGSPSQVENAAEIAMEHSLGLTCDPIGGLVQVPCIERNAIAAVKSINAARMAMWGDGRHTVSFDAVIETMRQTGLDMHSKYKETSTGGLAVSVVEC